MDRILRPWSIRERRQSGYSGLSGESEYSLSSVGHGSRPVQHLETILGPATDAAPKRPRFRCKVFTDLRSGQEKPAKQDVPVPGSPLTHVCMSVQTASHPTAPTPPASRVGGPHWGRRLRGGNRQPHSNSEYVEAGCSPAVGPSRRLGAGGCGWPAALGGLTRTETDRRVLFRICRPLGGIRPRQLLASTNVCDLMRA